MTTKRRILFVAEAVTLAHVARAASLISSLDPAEFDICLARHPRYDELLGELSCENRAIDSITPAEFMAALAKGQPLYTLSTLQRYVEADLALLREWRPHAVVGDFRLSLGVSARLAGVPYLNVCNAYWSPYARLRYPVPDIPLARLLGARLAQPLFSLARPLAFALHASALNQLRRRHGLPLLPSDLRHAYTDADAVLYADIAELLDMRDLPVNHHFLGPLAWAPRQAIPEWWAELPDDRPLIYVTLGSSGQAGRLGDILAALAELPVSVVAASAGHLPESPPPGNARVAAFLPGDLATQRAALVICNGGSPTSYQGLAAGIPVIGLASNLDQFLNMSLIEAAGAGILLRAHSATQTAIRSAVLTTLDQPARRRAARHLAEVIQTYDVPSRFRAALNTVLKAATPNGESAR